VQASIIQKEINKHFKLLELGLDGDARPARALQQLRLCCLCVGQCRQACTAWPTQLFVKCGRAASGIFQTMLLLKKKKYAAVTVR
jgi:hypothetical protein